MVVTRGSFHQIRYLIIGRCPFNVRVLLDLQCDQVRLSIGILCLVPRQLCYQRSTCMIQAFCGRFPDTPASKRIPPISNNRHLHLKHDGHYYQQIKPLTIPMYGNSCGSLIQKVP